MRKSLRSAAVVTAVLAATTTGLAVQASGAGASERTEAGAAACIGAVAQRLTDVVAATGADPELIDDVAFDQDFDSLEQGVRDNNRSVVRDVVRDMIDDVTARTASELGRSNLSLVSDPESYVTDCQDAADEAMDEFRNRAGTYYWYSNERPWRDFNRGWWRHWAPRYFYSGYDVSNGFPGRDITCRGPLSGLCIVNWDNNDWRFRDRDAWGRDFNQWRNGRVGFFRGDYVNGPNAPLGGRTFITPGARALAELERGVGTNATTPNVTTPNGTVTDPATGAVTSGTTGTGSAAPTGSEAGSTAPSASTTTDTAPALTAPTDTAPAADTAPSGSTSGGSTPNDSDAGVVNNPSSPNAPVTVSSNESESTSTPAEAPAADAPAAEAPAADAPAADAPAADAPAADSSSSDSTTNDVPVANDTGIVNQ